MRAENEALPAPSRVRERTWSLEIMEALKDLKAAKTLLKSSKETASPLSRWMVAVEANERLKRATRRVERLAANQESLGEAEFEELTRRWEAEHE